MKNAKQGGIHRTNRQRSSYCFSSNCKRVSTPKRVSEGHVLSQTGDKNRNWANPANRNYADQRGNKGRTAQRKKCTPVHQPLSNEIKNHLTLAPRRPIPTSRPPRTVVLPPPSPQPQPTPALISFPSPSRAPISSSPQQ